MTGTRASRATRSIRPLPPRGMITSTNSGIATRRPTAARSVVFDELHRRLGQAGVGQRALHAAPQRDVGADRLRAAAQDARVAALDGQRRGLDRDVGTALVDHAEHAQRHAHAAHADAAGALRDAGDLADRVGHLGELQAAVDDGVERMRVEAQAVEQRAGDAVGGGGGRSARWPTRARGRPRAGARRARATPRRASRAATRPCGRRRRGGGAERVERGGDIGFGHASIVRQPSNAPGTRRFRVSASVGSPRRVRRPQRR